MTISVRGRVTLILMMGLAIFWFTSAAKTAIGYDKSADIARRWITCQYTLKESDPYHLALTVLKSTFPESKPWDVKLSAIPKNVSAAIRPLIIPELGPPEAVYPPPAEYLMSVTVGLLANFQQAIYLQLLINLISLIIIVVLLNKFFCHPRSPSKPANLLGIILIFILFSPSYISVANSQMSLPILACLIYGLFCTKNDWWASAAMTIALIKPTLSLPFLILVFLGKKWRQFMVISVGQLVLLFFMARQVHASPIQLLREWMDVCGYFTLGMYNVPELLHGFGLAGTSIAKVAPAVILVIAWLGVSVIKSPMIYKFALLGIVSILWTYHGPYDFVLLLPSFFMLLGWVPRDSVLNDSESYQKTKVQMITGLSCFLIMSLALLPTIYEGDSEILFRLVRWFGRFALVYLLIITFIESFKLHITHKRFVSSKL